MKNEKFSFYSMLSKFAEDWWLSCAQIYKSYLHCHFCFAHVIGNIVIKNNCHLQIYKSLMHGHFFASDS